MSVPMMALPVSTMIPISSVLLFLICIVALRGLDKSLSEYNSKVRWYAIHCVTNAIVVVYTMGDVYRLLAEYNPQFNEVSLFPSILVMALHIYHCLYFSINRQDIIHHGVMSSVLIISMYNHDSGLFTGVTNYALFFLSGLPGGIDYLLMVRVELGQMDRLREKYYNQYLNTWIRSLGILYAAFYAYQQWLMGNVYTYYVWPIILALVWNAQYYSSSVSQSYGRSACLAG